LATRINRSQHTGASANLRFCRLKRERCKRALDDIALEPSDYEDDARTAIIVRPGRQVIRRVHEVLHAVDDNWPAVRTDVQQSFHAQDVAAMAMQQHGQPDAEGGPIQRPLETQTESMNAGIVTAYVQMM
jgi:hypothetical protein